MIKRYIILTIIGIALLFTGYQAYHYFGKGTLVIEVKPSDTVAIIDNRYYTLGQSKELTLTPGSHKITLVADGYAPSVVDVKMGWKSKKTINPVLNPKTFKQILGPLMPSLEQITYSIAQPQFFLDNTWAAGYVVSGAEESSVVLAILQRKDGKWRIVYYNNKALERSSITIPDTVYDYVKAYEGE